jgi:hypothetical protein
MSFSSAIRFYSEAAGVTKSNGLMRATGWEIADGSNSGVSVAFEVKVGAGYADLKVRKSGAKSEFVLRGAYVEGGADLGLEIKADPFGKAAERLWKILCSPSTDGKMLPSGALSHFYFGPACTQAGLDRADFDRSTWVYLNIAGTMGAIGGDIGLLLLMDRAKFAKALQVQPDSVPVALRAEIALFVGCKAWCIYAGSSFAMGVGVGAGSRVIQMISLT